MILLRSGSKVILPKVGYGYDVHRLAAGRTLILGGVQITKDFGPIAHSDGDVLLHAICDALLGAAGLGDIGKHFPDTDERFSGISGLVLLHETKILVSNAGFEIGNIDSTLILERPKIAPFIATMIHEIASALEKEPTDISIKATTSEGLGFVGVGEGIAAHAVVLLARLEGE